VPRTGTATARSAPPTTSTTECRPVRSFCRATAVGELDDLRGFRPLPKDWTLDWSRFVAIGGSSPQPSRLIDARLTDGLFDLPGPAGGLAFANLLRGQALGLPSGQDVARFLGVAQIHDGAELGTDLDPTPLWFYILKESELQAGGRHLGPTGGRVVAEVFAGLLELDRQSFINLDPRWTPAGAGPDSPFGLGELVGLALT